MPGQKPSPGTVVVTGAASGIGRRAVVQFAAAGWSVVAIARSTERAAAVVAEARAAATGGGGIDVVAADLADLSQVRAAATEIADRGPVAALVNNAAVFDLSRTSARMTVDGIEETFAVNHVAPFLLATTLAPALGDDGVVVTAASKGLLSLPWLRLDFDDLDSRRRYRPTRAYYRSKIAQLLVTAELGRRGRRAVALRIPSVRVDDEKLARQPALLRVPYRLKSRFAADPAEIARCDVRLADGRAGDGARQVDEHGRDVRWTNATDDAATAARLWTRTADLAGVTT